MIHILLLCALLLYLRQLFLENHYPDVKALMASVIAGEISFMKP